MRPSEPAVPVPAGTVAAAAEALHLISDLIHHAPGPAIDLQIAALVAARGADPAPAAAWLVTTIVTVAGRLDDILAGHGVTARPGLEQFVPAGGTR